MKKFLSIIAIAALMASCTDSTTTEDASADSSATPSMQSAPLDSSATTPADTAAVKVDSPAVK